MVLCAIALEENRHSRLSALALHGEVKKRDTAVLRDIVKLRRTPCCLIEMVGLLFFLVHFVWVEFCLLTYHKADDAAQRLLGPFCCSLGVPLVVYFSLLLN